MPFEIKAYVANVKPGVYQAVCTGVETRSAKDGSGDFRVWEFTLRDGTGRTVSASSSMSTTPKSKGGKWLAGLLGKAPQVGQTVEPVGQACTIVVELNDDGYERVIAVTAPADAATPSPVKPADVDNGGFADLEADPPKAPSQEAPGDLPF